MRNVFSHKRGTGIKITNLHEGAVEVLLYDAIGFMGIEAKDFVQELAGIKADEILLRINSPGGDVFDGVAIYNALRQHPAQVDVQVDGLAASAASFIAMAGENITVMENAFMMVHSAFGFTIGGAEDHRHTAGLLDKVDGEIQAIYQKRTGLKQGEVASLMEAETWFTADEAVEKGFADQVEEGESVDNSFDLSIFTHAPAALAQRDAGDDPSVREIERALRDAGLSRSAAKPAAVAALATVGQREAAPQTDHPPTAALAQLLSSMQGA